ncbi:MAG: GTP cyclohydrolase FolE2 [Anaerovibrio sp.]|uniref:GTP cyclohydrolase FolE2 n=1 Tax=Anaerovibrio sp. TaxID=1872532 RepID=UPI0025EB22FC|nr:GTP cyclohydrolase FolE2 [Anaerovibrio sp.]MCR5177304.1 GTP cyclohydrolase FolE2 [Anaerovibrio sp.]
MKDVQNSIDHRGIAIQNVGIRDVHMPLQIKTKEGNYQQVLGNISFTISLPMEYKGTHMSRFQEILNKWTSSPIAEGEMSEILGEALDRLQAEAASLHIEFKYFVDRIAPVSKRHSVLDVDCFFDGYLKRGEDLQFILGVKVPYTSLCPCSKEISDYGAHNQRGIMDVRVRFDSDCDCILIEDLVLLMEQQASCQIYPLLKREDEKFVTEKAYDNPKFVEDILRDGVLALRKLPGLAWFALECDNFESIHNHSAYARHEENVK